MSQIFEEYGRVIITVFAIICLIGVVTFLLGDGGTLKTAFSTLITEFLTKAQGQFNGI